MDHSHHSDEHDHPETFDEVIARGFPRDIPADVIRAHADARRARARYRAPRLPPVVAALVPAVREDQATMSPARQTAFKKAIEQMVLSGAYVALITPHMDMTHDMHGSMGAIGLYRFLPWHRRYLVELEQQLQQADAIIRPGAPDKLTIPYWRWRDPFPAWMAGFLPANDPVTGAAPPARKNAAPPAKANAADIDIIVNQFAIQQPGLPGQNDYTRFTWGLEGWGTRPNGSSLPAHNQGHSWIGGIMNNVMKSPTDPMFWLHHAEIDRLWEIWRQTHPGPGPVLAGADLVMDPWSEAYADLLDIAALGYAYDSLSL